MTIDEADTALAGTGLPPDRPARPAATFAATLAAIETMELGELRALWAHNFGTPPTLRSPELLRIVLGWRLQARTHGGIDAAMRRKLRRRTTPDIGHIALETGSTLTREWQGQTYTVLVVQDGFRWDEKTWPSLSAVASAIAGTRWNGPRFFGLRSARR